MSQAGLKALRVLYAIRLLIAESGGVGLQCIADFAGCSRMTVYRQMHKASAMGLVEMRHVEYRKGIRAFQYKLSETGIQLMGIDNG